VALSGATATATLLTLLSWSLARQLVSHLMAITKPWKLPMRDEAKAAQKEQQQRQRQSLRVTSCNSSSSIRSTNSSSSSSKGCSRCMRQLT